MKTILTILFIAILSTNLMSDEVKMTDEELIAEILKLDQKIENEKKEQIAIKVVLSNQKNKIKAQEIKIRNLKELEKTVDKLSKTLGVN